MVGGACRWLRRLELMHDAGRVMNRLRACARAGLEVRGRNASRTIHERHYPTLSTYSIHYLHPSSSLRASSASNFLLLLLLLLLLFLILSFSETVKVANCELPYNTRTFWTWLRFRGLM